MWKLPICLVSFGLWLGTLALVHTLVPGESIDATTQLTNGEVVFAIRSNKSAWVEVIGFPSFFLYPLFLMWIRRRSYFGVSNRENKLKGCEEAPSLWERWFTYAIVSVLGTFFVLVTVMLCLTSPLLEINRITISDNEIKLASLYTSWSIKRNDLDEVRVLRKVSEARGGGTETMYVMQIVIRDGSQYVTNRGIAARPSGGAEDKRYEDYFQELRNALTR